MKNKLTLTLNKVSIRGMLTMVLLLIGFGVLGTWWISKDVDRQMREELLHQTFLVGQAVNVNLVKSFTGTEADLGSSDYQLLRGQLSMILKTKNHCRYLYLLGRKPDGQVFFYLDTDEVDAAAPGEIYKEASKELRAMFATALPLVEGPLPDEWGTWVSGLVPIMDDGTGKMIAVLGMDIDARTWNWDVASRAAWPAGLMIAILTLMASGILVVRSRAEESIRVSEARLRRAEFASKSGNWELHLKSHKITVSEGAIKIYGIDNARFEYSDLKKIPMPEYRADIDNALKRLIEDDQPYDIEFKIKTADTGEIKDIHSSALYDKENGILFGIIQDITDRKRIEEALTESVQRYHLHFDNSLDAFLLTSPDGSIQSVNPATCEMFGWTQEEICQLGRNGIIDSSDPRLSTALEERSRTGKFFGELTGLRKDGSKFPIEISSTLFTDHDGNLRTSMIVQDISERKRTEKLLLESEAIFDQFLENSPVYIFFKDENIRSLRLSRNFEGMLGKNLNELLGKSMDELFPSDFAQKMVEDDRQVLNKREKIEIEEEFNGRCYSTIKFPIQIEGKPSFLAGFTLDITDRKLAEQALKKSELRLKELNAAKDKFFSIVSHDLKNPFNAIIGFSNILAEQVQEKNYEGIEEYAGIIRNSSQRAMDLLITLLEWSRSQTGRMEFSPEYVEMVALINEVIELLGDSAQQKSITIHRELPRKMIAFIDKAMISTILRNLISNAIKFTRPDGQIVISAETKKAELKISVHDNGVGIKTESIEKLFRIDENHTTLGTQDEKGTGLGLILCKEFIEKHGGKIWVESEVGRGSTFYFSIPNTE